MTRQGFIDFNTRLSPENSRKASSYAMAIRILDEVLPHQSVINLHGRSLYDISDVATIDSLIALVRVEQAKMRRRDRSLYDKAFDQGLITISPDDYSVILSSALRENETKAYYDKHFGCIDGQKMTMPTEYLPNRDNGICCMLSECRASKNTRATFN